MDAGNSANGDFDAAEPEGSEFRRRGGASGVPTRALFVAQRGAEVTSRIRDHKRALTPPHYIEISPTAALTLRQTGALSANAARPRGFNK